MPFAEGDPRLRLMKTAFVVYYHDDIVLAKQFLVDFGLQVVQHSEGDDIFFKGYGVEPFCYVARKSQTGESYFGGGAYSVESRHELERATAVPGASSIAKMNSPGGGEIVSLQDPAGFPVHLIFGQAEGEESAHHPQLEKLVINYENDKPRQGNFQRFLRNRPAPVHRWGHYGVTYPAGQYHTMFDWYTSTLTLAASDITYKDGKPTTCFLHIDRGEEYTDHHSFFFKIAKPGEKPKVAHSAFEVHDFDIQQVGHDYLVSKGYQLCWGVGRHILGSQIFDYWFDSSSFIVEHYADGDVVNNATKVAHIEAGPDALSVWGPPVPKVF